MRRYKILFKFFIGFTLILFSLYLSRFLILEKLGNYLLYEDKLEKADAIFVLSGNAFDRGNEAIKLFKEGYSEKIYCTGQNIPAKLASLGYPYSEARITQTNILRNGVPYKNVLAIFKGTSTLEESEIILTFCKNNEFEKAIIVTSDMHTRRVKMVFKELFNKNDIQTIIQGAPHSYYTLNKWWKSEDNFIVVLGEYAKSLYYLWKY